jgi:hypothetical protein
MQASASNLPEALHRLLTQLHPGAVVERVVPLGDDHAENDEATAKGIGYGVPVRLTVRDKDGSRRELVFHTARANDFDHDRRSDRAKNMLLAYDTFGGIPNHVAAIDVGAVAKDGSLLSLRDTGEFYLLTEFAQGRIYADDLRRIATDKQATPRDYARCEAVAVHLATLHAEKGGRPALYRRAIRNLVGDGEGIYGMIDGYPDGVPAAPPERLRAIERSCVDWRWKLREREHRLSRIHGDFHPFNILFDEQDRLTSLDASRGCLGDPADDTTCLAVNYVFFALEHEGAWHGGLGEMWRRFWRCYLDRTGDHELLEVAPPYLAWRALVIANPVWYPAMHENVRDSLLRLAEEALDAGRLDLDSAERLFR